MENLRKCRKLKHCTQEALAKEIGCCRATLIEIEKGRIEPTKEQVDKMASYLNVSPFKLYGIDILKYLPTTREDYDQIIEILKNHRLNLSAAKKLNLRQ